MSVRLPREALVEKGFLKDEDIADSAGKSIFLSALNCSIDIVSMFFMSSLFCAIFKLLI